MVTAKLVYPQLSTVPQFLYLLTDNPQKLLSRDFTIKGAATSELATSGRCFSEATRRYSKKMAIDPSSLDDNKSTDDNSSTANSRHRLESARHG